MLKHRNYDSKLSWHGLYILNYILSLKYLITCFRQVYDFSKHFYITKIKLSAWRFISADIKVSRNNIKRWNGWTLYCRILKVNKLILVKFLIYFWVSCYFQLAEVASTQIRCGRYIVIYKNQSNSLLFRYNTTFKLYRFKKFSHDLCLFRIFKTYHFRWRL